MTGYGRSLRIAIVDNSEEVLSALSRVIDSQYDLHLVAAAAGVDEGIAAVRSLRPDVVVLDVNMPDGGGQRAAREMIDAVPAVHIIAFSAFDKVLIRKAMAAAGATAYVSKSASIDELLDAIRATPGAAY